MEQKKLRDDLARSHTERVYLLYGAETWLHTNFITKIADVLRVDAAGRHTFTDAGAQDIISVAMQMSFFSTHRLLIARECGFFSDKKKADAALLADFVPQIPQDVTLVFAQKDVDRRMKLFKTIDAQGAAVECAQPTPDTLAKWLVTLAKKGAKTLDRQNANKIIAACGTDMHVLDCEMQKLIASARTAEITAADIDEITTHTPAARIFELTKAVGQRRLSDALHIYATLLAQKESPHTVLFMITRQMRAMLYTRQASAHRLSTAQIAKDLGLRDFMVNEARTHAAAFGDAALRAGLECCLATESSIKQGRIADELAIELLIIKLARHGG